MIRTEHRLGYAHTEHIGWDRLREAFADPGESKMLQCALLVAIETPYIWVSRKDLFQSCGGGSLCWRRGAIQNTTRRESLLNHRWLIRVELALAKASLAQT